MNKHQVMQQISSTGVSEMPVTCDDLTRLYSRSVYGNQGSPNELDRSHQEQALDEALMESFPASDPVAVNFGYVVRQGRH